MSSPFTCPSLLFASFFELIIVVVAVSGVRAAGITVGCWWVNTLGTLGVDEPTVALRYASD